MGRIAELFFGLFTLIVGVAILSVIVSRNSNTVGVLNAWGNTFAKSLGAATAPVTGAAVGTNNPLLYPATNVLSGFGGALTGNMAGLSA